MNSLVLAYDGNIHLELDNAHCLGLPCVHD